MKILFGLLFVLIASYPLRADEDAPIILSTVNVDSDPDDNIIEVSAVYSVASRCDAGAISGLEGAATIHELRPTDVGVVGAIGDSMTAALFAKVKGIFGIVGGLFDKHKLEYRGVSWSMGGDSDATTMPNFIREFNANLKGYSVGTGKEGSSNAGYNFAVSGAVASDLLEQANNLVSKIKSDNLDDEWKVITLFIGGNDLCAVCSDEVTFSPDNFYMHVKAAIDKLAELNNIFINLVETVQVTDVSVLSKDFGCHILQGLMVFIDKCSCINKDVVIQRHQEYVEKMVALETYYQDEMDDRDDFTVVLQPFFGKTNIPTTNPLSYFSPDCFHLSQKGHLNAAVALWNNMLQPIGSKTEELSIDRPVLCPTAENPFFYTHKNSGRLSANSHVTKAAPEAQGSPLSTGQIAGIIIGTLLVVAAGMGVVIVSVLGVYMKYRKPRFSEYTSLNKKIRY